jgi:hypothetical protein
LQYHECRRNIILTLATIYTIQEIYSFFNMYQQHLPAASHMGRIGFGEAIEPIVPHLLAQ